MIEMKYFLTSNIIEDTLVSYGICSILFDNGISYELIRNKSHYLIRYDEKDIDEDEGIGFEEITEEEAKTWLNGSNNWTCKKKNLDKTNKYFCNNIENLLEDFKNHNYGKKTKVGSVGNNFNGTTLNFGGTGVSQQSKEEMIVYLSYLGHIKYIGYNKSLKGSNVDFEYDLLLVPKLKSCITNIKAARNIYIDKEGNTKIYNFWSNKSNVESEALGYLSSLINLYQENINYEQVIFMTSLVTANNNARDIVKKVKVENYSLELVNLLKTIINFDKTDLDIRQITAIFVLENSYRNFEKLIKVYAKKDQMLNIKFGEEIISMFSNKIQEIYNNESVKKLGERLGEMLRENKGYDIMTQFLNTNNEFQLSNIIPNVITEYNRYAKMKDKSGKGWFAIDDTQLIDIINLVDNKKDAVITSRAIVAYAKVFFTKKDKTQEN